LSTTKVELAMVVAVLGGDVDTRVGQPFAERAELTRDVLA